MKKPNLYILKIGLINVIIFLAFSSVVVAQQVNDIRVEKLTDDNYSIEVDGLDDIYIKTGIITLGTDIKIKTDITVEDNSVAFRYIGKGTSPITIKNELSSWTLPLNTKVWFFERDNTYKLKSHAGTWTSCSLKDLHSVSKMGSVQGLPLIFQFENGTYGLLTEVGLRDYSGMRIDVKSNGQMCANFTEKDGFEVGNRFVSPWRVLYFAKDLNDLVNQNIVEKLSPKPDKKLYKDRSYIVPGMCTWRWFSKFTGTPAQEKEIVDQAFQLGFRYSMVDDGWHKWSDSWTEMKKLVEYAESKSVKIIAWKHSHQILNPVNNYEDMRNWLDSIKLSGVAGVKVDFMDSEAKKFIDFDIKLLEEAAKRQLLIIFHGCQKPSGEQYTYPNEITREGIRGIELNKMNEGYISASHNAALPFTRLVIGNGDYTPLTFTVPGRTTFAHQLATLVCFTSAMQVITEDPDILIHNEKVNPALNLIKGMPTVWDETIVLKPSEIGKLAVIARRKSDKWYVGVLNGENIAKSITLDLSFIDILKRANIEMYLDDQDADKVLLSMEGHRKGRMKREPSIPFKVEQVAFKSNITLKIAPNGGSVLVL